jgi:transposase-like protein
MKVQMAKRNGSANRNKAPRARRVFDREFKEQAVQMMLDGLSASTVSGNLGIDNTNLLYRWKKEILEEGGTATVALDSRVRDLEEKLRRTERERDVLKKALAIFSRSA